MSKYRDLNAPPGQQMEDIVRKLRDAARSSKTGAHGVKDMGPSGDVVWTRPEAPEFKVSIRDIDGDLQAAQGRIDEAKAESAEALVRAGEAEATVGVVRDGLDELETVTLPGAVSDLEAADQANAQAVVDAEQAAADSQAALATQIEADIEAARTDLTADIATVRTSVDGKSKITQSLDAPPTEYAGAVGDRWERMSSMGAGGQLVSNWRWNGTVWVSTIISDAVLGNVDAGKLVAGSATINSAVIDKLWADGVMAKSVTTQSLVVGPGNVLPDPNGLDPVIRERYSNGGFSWSEADKAWVRTTPGASNQIKPNPGGDYASFPLLGGRTYAMSFDVKVEGSTARSRFAIYYTGRDGATSFVGDQIEEGGDTTNYADVPADTWFRVNRTWVCPEDAVMGGFSLQANSVDTATATRVLFRNPFVGPKANAVSIEDGAVTTGKVAANAITAGKILAGSIEAQHIKAGAITIGKVTDLQASLDGKETPAGAQSKADAAKVAAQSAAASDAQAKADAAKAAAEAAAKTYADTVASGASSSAIAAAKADATAKADAAQSAAVTAAAAAAATAYGETKSLVSGWRVTGQTTIAGGSIAADSISSAQIKAGAVTAEKITVTSALSASIVDAMSVSAKKLVVSDEAILNKATLIGNTVVENINVTGKLVGSGGVFTGTVDFANVNVTGEQIVNKLSANSISADKIEGGNFTGETFTGGTFTGGLFRTSDALPGEVRLADNGYVTGFGGGGASPGIGITPTDTSDMAIPAGIGPSVNGLEIYGGRSLSSGMSSVMQSSPGASLMRTFRADGSTIGLVAVDSDAAYMQSYQSNGMVGGEMAAGVNEAFMRSYREDGTKGGVLQSNATSSLMRTYRANGEAAAEILANETSSTMRSRSGNGLESGWVRSRSQDAEIAYLAPDNTYFSRVKADTAEAFMFTRAGGTSRYLSVDANGIWTKTLVDGVWKMYNLEETAQDSGWVNLSYASGIQNGSSGGPFQIRRMGGMIHLRGRIERTSGDFAAGTEYTLGTLSAAWRPSWTQRTLIAGGGSSQWGRIEVSSSTGAVTIAMISGAVSWIDLSGTMWTFD